LITAVDGRWWARANLRPSRPREEPEQPSVPTGGVARGVAIWAHEERGLREVGLWDDADRKVPEACDVLGGLLLLGLGDDEPEGGIQVSNSAVAFGGSPTLRLLGPVHAPAGAVGDVELRKVLREPLRQAAGAAGDRDHDVAEAAGER